MIANTNKQNNASTQENEQIDKRRYALRLLIRILKLISKVTSSCRGTVPTPIVCFGSGSVHCVIVINFLHCRQC
jgi:hypothetical protein